MGVTLTERHGSDPAARFVRALGWVCVLAFLGNVVRWGTLFPINSVPDERVRFFMVEHLYRFGHWPRLRGPDLPFTGPLSGFRYLAREWWYHGLPNLDVAGAWLTTSAFAGALPHGHGWLAARAFNWLLAPVFAATVLAIAGTVAGDRLRGLCCGAVVLAIPQLTFIFSYMNSDGLALTAASLVLLAALRLAAVPSPGRAAALGLGMGVVLCTKIYYFPVLAAAPLLGGVELWRRGAADRRRLLRLGGVVALVAVVVALPILAATWAAYGEAFGAQGQRDYVALVKDQPGFLYGTCFLLCKTAVVNAATTRWWGWLVFKSFFYGVGYLDTWLPGRVYLLFFVPLALLLAGASVARGAVLLRLATRGRDAASDLAFVAVFWLVLLGTAVLNLLGQQAILPQPQGRYLFVAIPFLAAMLPVVATPPGRRARAGVTITLLVLAGLVGTNLLGYTVAADAHLRTRTALF